MAVESLARWTHAERGPISPAVFIPLAEESGLIPSLGLLVLDETCRQLAEWDRVLGAAAPQRANVNVSALQLDEALPPRWRRRCTGTSSPRPASPSRSPSRRS